MEFSLTLSSRKTGFIAYFLVFRATLNIQAKAVSCHIFPILSRKIVSRIFSSGESERELHLLITTSIQCLHVMSVNSDLKEGTIIESGRNGEKELPAVLFVRDLDRAFTPVRIYSGCWR